MNRTMYPIATLLLCILTGAAVSQSPDLQGIMDGLQAKLDVATENGWTENIWSTVTPNPGEEASWAQKAPTFSGYDHTGNGIKDDDQLALLQQVLLDAPDVVEVLGQARVDRIKAAFAANRDRVADFEIWYDLEILDSSRTNVSMFGIPLNDRTMYSDRTRFHTGQPNALSICVVTGAPIVGTICEDETFDLPSIWSPDGLLNENSPGLADDIAHLTAAYLTIGNQEQVDYWQAVLYQVVCRGILPLGSSPIFDSKRAKTHLAVMGYGMADFPEWTVGTKAYTAPLLPDIHSDTTYDTPIRNCLNDACTNYADIVRLVWRIYGDSMQQGIGQAWLASYQVGENGFGAGNAEVLGAAGDFNGDGRTNVESYNEAGQDRTAWFADMKIVEVNEEDLAFQEEEASDDGVCGCIRNNTKMKDMPGEAHRFFSDWLLPGISFLGIAAYDMLRRGQGSH